MVMDNMFIEISDEKFLNKSEFENIKGIHIDVHAECDEDRIRQEIFEKYNFSEEKYTIIIEKKIKIINSIKELDLLPKKGKQKHIKQKEKEVIKLITDLNNYIEGKDLSNIWFVGLSSISQEMNYITGYVLSTLFGYTLDHYTTCMDISNIASKYKVEYYYVNLDMYDKFYTLPYKFETKEKAAEFVKANFNTEKLVGI